MPDPSEWTFDTVDDHVPGRADPLGYPGYGGARTAARRRSGVDESVLTGRVLFGSHEARLALFQFSFMGGSIGEDAGHRLALALAAAAADGLPFVLRTATGGVRLQEGLRALAQMAKVVAARQALAEARVPFVAVLGNPTTGGALAALAATADVTVAETGATVGFAGPRVSERATGRPLGPRSHTAAAALAHGLVDAVVDPGESRAFVAHVLEVLAPDDPLPVPAPAQPSPGHVDAWDAVRAVRAPGRPRAPDVARLAADRWVELRGDRAGVDDKAVTVLAARFGGRRAVVVALDRDHFIGPSGYRKSIRAVRLASRLGLPVVTLIDSRGADPSQEAEAGGIAWAVAGLFEAVIEAPVPVLAIVTGEGGGGGALAFAAGDVVLAYEDAIFTVISPELAAEILWRDPGRAPEAARLLRPSSHDLVASKLADGLLASSLDGRSLRAAVVHHLDRMAQMVTGAHPRAARWRSL